MALVGVELEMLVRRADHSTTSDYCSQDHVILLQTITNISGNF